MRVLQLNLNHCEAAQDILKQTVLDLRIDLALLSEHYNASDNSRWAASRCNKASIWTCGKFPLENSDIGRECFVKSTVNGVHFFSCYFPPSLSFGEYERGVDNLVSEVRNLSPVVIAGDFNAWAVEWGSAYTNARGERLLEAFTTLNVVLLNCGEEDTFSRNGRGSKIDLTFISDTLASSTYWKVSDVYTHSDHHAIFFEIQERSTGSTTPLAPSGPQWKDSTFDRETFVVAMGDIQLAGSANDKAMALMRRVTEACNASMVKRRQLPGRRHAYWWNVEIAELRQRCMHARRLCLRARGRENFTELQERHKALKSCLKRAIAQSKTRCYREMCADVENNPWGTGYKVVMRKLYSFRPPTTTCSIRLRSIIEGLFPQRAETTYAIRNRTPPVEIPEVTSQEVDAACKALKLNKAPGVDGIPNVALKTAIENNSELFRKVFDACIKEKMFPKIWKRQRLVLIPKGNGKQDASGYRPLCMIDTAGKLLEKIICKRLEIALNGEGLSNYQFGFRKARSTVDAIERVVNIATDAIKGKRWLEGDKEYCAIITLDVKNAFNSADWDATLAALEEKRVPKYLIELIADYFKDRVLFYDTADGRKSYGISAGVPQGSVLGPILWNVMYDGVLRLELPNGAHIVGFADDIALVVRGKYLDKLERACNDSVAIVRSWILSKGLKLAENKTEALLVSSRKKMEFITITVGDQRIASKQAIKYLGVVIDNRLTFKQHLKYISEKCASTTCALARIMPNLGGPKQERRLLLTGVVKSIALYAAPIWARAMIMRSYRRDMDSAYRRCCLRVASAFRTVSTDAALVVAGMMPLQLLAENERIKHVSGRSGAEYSAQLENNALEKWQSEWNISLKGRWTHRLIPRVAIWVRRSHGQVNFYLTQMLTGHGCFRAYLFKYGHDDNDLCPECPNVSETAEHVFFYCPRYENQRFCLEMKIRSYISPDNIVGLMLTSVENWNLVCVFAREILELQRIAERARSAERGSSVR